MKLTYYSLNAHLGEILITKKYQFSWIDCSSLLIFNLIYLCFGLY